MSAAALDQLRTASRMLTAVRRAVGEAQFEFEADTDGRKRWRMVRPVITGLFRLGAEELATLDPCPDFGSKPFVEG